MTAQRFTHEALVYHDQAEFRAGVVPFVEAAVRAREPVLVATPPANLELLRGALGDAAAEVRLRDICQEGRNPGRILPAVLLRFARAHPGRRVRVVCEPVWPGRGPLEYPACVQHEALLNAAFTGQDAAVLCPYDRNRLDRRVIEDAERTHPYLTGTGGRRRSDRFGDPVATAAAFNLPLPRPPESAVTVPVGGRDELRVLREVVSAQARAAGVPPHRVGDLTVAVNELASNTISHSAVPGTFASWSEDGYLVCQLTDHGHIADPLAGRVPPTADAESGRGLFVVNYLCDLVRIHTRPGRGAAPGRTTIRIHVATG